MRQLNDSRGTLEDRLATFLGLDFIKKVPESFQAYCQAAVQGERQQLSAFSHKGAMASVHMMNVMELSITDFVDKCPTYTGAHLILTMMPKVPFMHVHSLCLHTYIHILYIML